MSDTDPIHTGMCHPRTGEPLVISRGLGGPSGPWLVFVRHGRSLRRVVTKALPPRDTPAQAQGDVRQWVDSCPGQESN